MSTAVVKVDNVNIFSSKDIQDAASTYAAKNGYVQIDATSLGYVGIDVDPSQLDVNSLKQGAKGDSVPLFQLISKPVDLQTYSLVIHAMSKNSGTKTYSKKRMIFAINNGKVDGNGTNAGTQINFMNVSLTKVPEWPCDDIVTATLTYTLAFTQM